VPILAAATSPVVRRRLMLSWGVYPCEIPQVSSLDELFDQGAKLSTKTEIARSGDLIVITAGIPIAVPGTTNLLKVERIK
jgi:pyruvate kinase